MARETLEQIEVERPQPSAGHAQNLCLDKGYDYPEVRQLAREFNFTLHLRCRGEEARALKYQARAKARRWVVERTHSWLNRFRGILIRWNKKADNYLALLHLALGIITYRATGLLG
jgi:putative transposase